MKTRWEFTPWGNFLTTFVALHGNFTNQATAISHEIQFKFLSLGDDSETIGAEGFFPLLSQLEHKQCAASLVHNVLIVSTSQMNLSISLIEFLHFRLFHPTPRLARKFYNLISLSPLSSASTFRHPPDAYSRSTICATYWCNQAIILFKMQFHRLPSPFSSAPSTFEWIQT